MLCPIMGQYLLTAGRNPIITLGFRRFGYYCGKYFSRVRKIAGSALCSTSSRDLVYTISVNQTS